MGKQNVQAKEVNGPFYGCLLSDLAYEWLRGCRRPCIDTDLTAFVMQIVLLLLLF